MAASRHVRRRKNSGNSTNEERDATPLLDTPPKQSLSNPSKSNAPSVIQKKKTKWEKFKTRFIYTWLMVFALIAWLYLAQHIGFSLLVLLIQAMAFNELTSLRQNESIEKQLSSSKYIYKMHWSILLSSIFYYYGKLILEHVSDSVYAYSHLFGGFKYMIREHEFVSFTLVVLNVVLFVMSLREDKLYKYQFQQLGWTIVTIVVTIVLSSNVLWNIYDGLAWVLVPAFLIITNDVWAYMWGISFGKTPLIRLSPNKTWEGAIGAAVTTLLLCWFYSWWILDKEFFVCPKQGLDFVWPSCEIHPVFVQVPFVDLYLPSFFETFMMNVFRLDIRWFLADLMIAPFQMHVFVFALFASVIGPFGGFFASGFKRAFKIKDFADTIPGHGGIIDRMDCQLLMCAFVHYYRKVFVSSLSMVHFSDVWRAVQSMTEEDQREMYQRLSNQFSG